MNLFFKKNTLHKFFHSWIFLSSLLIVVIIFFMGVVGAYKKNKEARGNKNIASEQVDQLVERDGELTALIDTLHTDEGIEESIRDKFSLVKEGEKSIVIVDDPATVSPDEVTQNRRSFIQFLKDLF